MNRIDTWTFLSTIGQNKIVNKTYTFLIIVPLLINTLEELRYSSLINSIPFNWKLFFFSALSFTIITILYNLFCPNIIKENKSFSSFVNDRKNWSHISKYQLNIGADYDKFISEFDIEFDINNISEINPVNLESWLNKFGKNKKNIYSYFYKYMSKFKSPFSYSGIYNDVSPIEAVKQYAIDSDRIEMENIENVFYATYELANEKNRIARYICVVFLLVGISLFAIIVMQSVITVLESSKIY